MSTEIRKSQGNYTTQLANTVPKNSPKRWALYAHGVGNQCPAHVLSMPSTWSLSAHVTGIKRPADGPYLTEIVDTSLLLFLLF